MTQPTQEELLEEAQRLFVSQIETLQHLKCLRMSLKLILPLCVFMPSKPWKKVLT